MGLEFHCLWLAGNSIHSIEPDQMWFRVDGILSLHGFILRTKRWNLRQVIRPLVLLGHETSTNICAIRARPLLVSQRYFLSLPLSDLGPLNHVWLGLSIDSPEDSDNVHLILVRIGTLKAAQEKIVPRLDRVELLIQLLDVLIVRCFWSAVSSRSVSNCIIAWWSFSSSDSRSLRYNQSPVVHICLPGQRYLHTTDEFDLPLWWRAFDVCYAFFQNWIKQNQNPNNRKRAA